MKKSYLIVSLVQAFLITVSTLLFPITVHSQELTEAQRQERCQNIKNQIAALQTQLKNIDAELPDIISQEEMDDKKYQLEFVRVYMTFLRRYMKTHDENDEPNKGLFFRIARLNNVSIWNLKGGEESLKSGYDLLNCAIELEKKLSNKNTKNESQYQIDNDTYYLNFVRVYLTFMRRYLNNSYEHEPDETLLYRIAVANNVKSGEKFNGIDDRLNYAIEVEKILSNKIDKNVSLQNKNPGLTNKKNELDKQLAFQRSNLIALRCLEAGVAQWNGTFTDIYSTFNFTGGSGSASATWTYAISDSKGTGSLTSTRMEGNTISGTWKVQHEDDTKTGSRSGTFTLTLSGNTITGQLLEDTPKWSYKPGYSAANVDSKMKKGASWSVNISRKK